MNRQAMISSQAINLNELSWYIAVPCPTVRINSNAICTHTHTLPHPVNRSKHRELSKHVKLWYLQSSRYQKENVKPQQCKMHVTSFHTTWAQRKSCTRLAEPLTERIAQLCNGDSCCLIQFQRHPRTIKTTARNKQIPSESIPSWVRQIQLAEPLTEIIKRLCNANGCCQNATADKCVFKLQLAEPLTQKIAQFCNGESCCHHAAATQARDNINKIRSVKMKMWRC